MHKDISALFLYIMEWNCSAFTRVFGFSQTLFSFWFDCLRSSDICDEFIARDVKLFAKLCETHFGEEKYQIDDMVSFLMTLKKVKVNWP